MELLAICPTVLGLRCLHRQRQNLLNAVQFGSEFRQTDMYGKKISEVLR